MSVWLKNDNFLGSGGVQCGGLAYEWHVYWVVALGGNRQRSWVEEVVGLFRAGVVFLFIGFFFFFFS